MNPVKDLALSVKTAQPASMMLPPSYSVLKKKAGILLLHSGLCQDFMMQNPMPINHSITRDSLLILNTSTVAGLKLFNIHISPDVQKSMAGNKVS